MIKSTRGAWLHQRMTGTPSRFTTALVVATAVVALMQPSFPARAEDIPPADQQYRPLVHFTPETNWMNDPNGLVYVDGTYHLFYQHNPSGTRWGNMSWGHATSTDLLTWTEQPLAIPQTFNDAGQSIEDIFSGSVVVDTGNTSGFGAPGGPDPLVAVYTSAYTDKNPDYAGIQAQSLAYSLDEGQSWTKYAHNPVLNRNSQNFRDPKVFRYTGDAGSYWVMVAVEATEHRVLLYRSDNLIDWTYLSDFGPANSTAGIWECPDLFPLPVDGDGGEQKWVMIVNLNPGGVAGGSGGQYFVGDFDGTTFESESTVSSDAIPAGTVIADFEHGYGDWTVNNEVGNWKNGPFGDAPASGTLPGQNAVSGFVGSGLVNGFNDGDWPLGTMSSPDFTISDDYVNLLVGGGNHPHVDGTQLRNDPPAGRTLFDFELPDGQTLADAGWTLTGDFATEPWRNPSTAGGDYYLGAKRINTWEGGPKGDDNQGEMTSPAFTIDGSQISFLIGGGTRTDGSLEAELLVDGEVVRAQTGPQAGQLNWAGWDVSELRGHSAQIRILDHATGGWGHLTFDNVVIGDTPAQRRSEETSVNLVVDGQIVRTATGADSETLDWTSWNVREFRGQQAHIEVIDNNRFGWGHILVDQIMQGPDAAPTRLESYDWLDWGRDYYAGVSYSGAPTAGRVMQAWMNNWSYAEDIPTSTWRSSMALPREVTLVSTPRGPRLAQKPVAQLQDQLETEAARTRTDVSVDGTVDLDLRASTARIDVVLDPGSSSRAGISVFSDATTGTLIGYDSERGRVFVDRRTSGDTGFNPAFASIEDAPIVRNADGTVTLELYLDRASVELFDGTGLTTITDQVFPRAGADAVTAWSEGGAATLKRITVTPLRATMWKPADQTPPTITPTITGTKGSGDWYTSDVGVTWSVTDAESAVATTDGCAPTTVAADTTGTTLSCRATSAGGSATDDIVIARDGTAPSVALVDGPADGASYPANAVPSAPTCSASDDTSGLDGACVVSGYDTSVGTHTVQATATDIAGNTATTAHHYTVTTPAPAHLAITAGDAQEQTAGQPFATPLTVTVTDSTGAPVAGADVVFTVARGSATFGTATSSTVRTDEQGRAAAVLTAGRTAGAVSVTATVAGQPGVAAGSFTETVLSVTKARADLSATLSGLPSTLRVGQNATVSITITNRGPNAATSILTALSAGRGLRFVSAERGTIGLGKHIAVWTGDDLASGASRTYRAVVTATESGRKTTVVGSTLSSVPDPALSNNIRTQSITLQ